MRGAETIEGKEQMIFFSPEEQSSSNREFAWPRRSCPGPRGARTCRGRWRGPSRAPRMPPLTFLSRRRRGIEAPDRASVSREGWVEGGNWGICLRSWEGSFIGGGGRAATRQPEQHGESGQMCILTSETYLTSTFSSVYSKFIFFPRFCYQIQSTFEKLLSGDASCEVPGTARQINEHSMG